MALPFGLEPAAAAFLAVAVFGAAFVRGYSGFGFAALVILATSLVTSPLHAVPVVILCDIVMTVQQARGIWARIDWRRVGTLMLGALAGVPLGVTIITSIGTDLARAVIALFVLVMCALLWIGWSFRGHVGDVGTTGTGFVSGLANGAGVGGLPVAVFMTAQPVAAAVFRATLIAYFTLMDLWSLPIMARAGMVSADTFRATLFVLPMMAAGIWLGGRQFLKAEPQDFRRFALLLLAGLATLGLLKSVI
ncbi:sulfite exporter TauE/SafE family protein [Defluviimonas sp. WL0024]|uniref:Probable membrane transporter protein n=2 Tax=Albidovulum TaxID=205889 RepID=A0ABT3IXD2_9RHOB|nr:MULTISPECIES: sulfite exporter TauE/SafE family protein [Defluviimonas]MCU9846513.1 sulfite exporter TauE/SafE family protein [Defluviimonas sp. WL0024]MCW3780092.1 sulfite exporter TauE/SafE family protein [Defluviimonas salinarum]